MPSTARTSLAFSPCNITGFFQIRDHRANPLAAGSTGAGVAIDHGVTTKLTIRRAPHSSTLVKFNGRLLRDAIVSKSVIEQFLRLDGRDWDVTVSHGCDLPVGCGYGTSGAGALGLSFALNDAMGLSLTKTEAAGIAHISEIRCRTGLGTVASVFFGGFNLRTSPGAPGTGAVRTLNHSPDHRVVSASFGPLPTRKVLSSYELRKRVNACSRALTSEFMIEKTETAFVALSRRFADCLGLVSHRLRKVIEKLDSNDITSSMMMLGESLFCLIPSELVPQTAEVIGLTGLVPVVSRISLSGANLV